MITVQAVKDGFEAGVVALIVDPDVVGSGTVCQIGDTWFYFGGQTAEELSPEEYMRCVPMDDIAEKILDVLDNFHQEDGCFGDAYAYYNAILKETKD